MNAEKVGKFISQIRTEKKWTQSELAEKINVTNKAVSRWERGLGLPDISLLEPLSKELDISILELLNGEYIEEQELTQKKDINLLLNCLIRFNQKSETEKILKINIFFTILTIGIFFFTFRFQGYDNTYFFKLENNFQFVPFSNLFSGWLTKNFFPFFYNLVFNFIIGVVISTYVFYITKNNKQRGKWMLIINIFLEIIKWITLFGIFDINDIFIRMCSYFLLYFISKK